MFLTELFWGGVAAGPCPGRGRSGVPALVKRAMVSKSRVISADL